MNNNTMAPLDLVPLDSETRKIAQQILDEHDVDKVKDLTNLFNLNAQKRNVMRVMKMNELLDNVTDQIMERFQKTPANFSNEDLIKLMQVTETSIERANKSLNLVEQTPAIQYQQNNQVNINIGSELDRESRQRVTDTVQAILARMKTQPTIVESNNEGDNIIDAG